MQTLFNHPFLGRGFRPFFFFGALYSVLSLALWGSFYAGYLIPPVFLLDPIAWHAHEMLYGYTMAIVAGFLLTAVANWTGGAPARQMHLAGLCLLWVLGRIVMNIDLGLPSPVIYMIEFLFIPALAISLAIPLMKSWNKRNFIFLTLLSILFACDLWFLISENMAALYVALMMIMVMVSLIGGRIIPAFTVAGLRRRDIQAFQTPQLKTDISALISLVAVTICLIFFKETFLLTICAAASSVIHVVRMRYYHSSKTLNDPMLWILHVGYLWLVLGLFLLALTGLGILKIPVVIHALTTGCIGSMTLGMMCRVSLGHTGRPLIASKMTTVAFVLMQIAALMRVFGPLLAPDMSSSMYIGSASLWATCFFLFILVYSPALWQPRPDGRPA